MSLDLDHICTLAARYRAGERHLYDELVAAGYPLVRLRIRVGRWFLPGRAADYHDLVQEGIIGYVEAIDRWDPQNGTPFTLFASVLIDRDLDGAVRRVTRIMRRAQNEAVSLHAPAFRDKYNAPDDDGGDRLSMWELPDPSGLGSDPADLVAEAEDGPLLEAFKQALSAYELDVMTRFLAGYNYREIAAALGRAPKSVDNALQRLRRKLCEVAGQLAHDSRFSPDVRALLARVSRLAGHRFGPNEIAVRKAKRAGSAITCKKVQRRWVVPPEEMLSTYPTIREIAAAHPIRAQLLELYLQGLSYDEIARRLGIQRIVVERQARRLCQLAARAAALGLEQLQPGA